MISIGLNQLHTKVLSDFKKLNISKTLNKEATQICLLKHGCKTEHTPTLSSTLDATSRRELSPKIHYITEFYRRPLPQSTLQSSPLSFTLMFPQEHSMLAYTIIDILSTFLMFFFFCF